MEQLERATKEEPISLSDSDVAEMPMCLRPGNALSFLATSAQRCEGKGAWTKFPGSCAPDVESQKASPARSRSPTPAIAEEKVLLVCKMEMRGEVKCALRPTDPFNKLFEAFRKNGVQQVGRNV